MPPRRRSRSRPRPSSPSSSSSSSETAEYQFRYLKNIPPDVPYSNFFGGRRPPPPPPPTFIVPDRPSKRQPSIIHPHSLFPGVYVAADHDYDAHSTYSFLYTRNLVPGVQSLEDDVVFSLQDEDGHMVEYREWDPFKSRLAAAILSGVQNIWIEPGSRVILYCSQEDQQFGITISHISDIVGPQGMVYVVEKSNRNNLLDMADKRFNIVPVVHSVSPSRYHMLINMVDVLFAAPNHPEEVQMAFLNAMYFLKTGGHYMLYVQGNCKESTKRGDGVFSSLPKKNQVQFQRMEQVTLEPFDRDHVYVSGIFRTLEIAEIEPSCLVSHNFWTSEDSHRDDGRRISLYEKHKNLPVYMLFESSCGYIVFEARGVYKVKRHYFDTEGYIKNFDENFKFVACHAFESSDEALMYLIDDGNDKLPNNLREFLERELPQGMKDDEHCYSLAISNALVAADLVNIAKIACSISSFHIDIIRGVRMNIDKFFKNMKPGDLEKAQVDLARIYGRQKLNSPEKRKLPKKRGASRSVPTRQNPMRKARADAKTEKNASSCLSPSVLGKDKECI